MHSTACLYSIWVTASPNERVPLDLGLSFIEEFKDIEVKFKYVKHARKIAKKLSECIYSLTIDVLQESWTW